jgi:hypothetical protein
MITPQFVIMLIISPPTLSLTCGPKMAGGYHQTTMMNDSLSGLCYDNKKKHPTPVLISKDGNCSSSDIIRSTCTVLDD